MFFQRIYLFFISVYYILAFLYEENVCALLRIKKGRHCRVEPTVSLRFSENISIGDNSFINHYCLLWAGKKTKIVIGKNVLLGPGVKIFTASHGIQKGILINRQPWEEDDVIIGNDVWIGADVVILKGTHIGDGCVVGAGSVITGQLENNSIYAGVPARFIQLRK